jgi:hypothetical protein
MRCWCRCGTTGLGGWQWGCESVCGKVSASRGAAAAGRLLQNHAVRQPIPGYYGDLGHMRAPSASLSLNITIHVCICVVVRTLCSCPAVSLMARFIPDCLPACRCTTPSRAGRPCPAVRRRGVPAQLVRLLLPSAGSSLRHVRRQQQRPPWRLRKQLQQVEVPAAAGRAAARWRLHQQAWLEHLQQGPDQRQHLQQLRRRRRRAGWSLSRS